MIIRTSLLASLLAAGLALAACGGSVGIPASEKEGKAPPIEAAFIRFPDMPLTVGVDFDMDRTLVFGAEDSWFGRLVISSSHSPNDMFDFYKQKLPEFGWQEITSIRAAISVLTFARQDRIATIQVQGATLIGSEVFITVSKSGTIYKASMDMVARLCSYLLQHGIPAQWLTDHIAFQRFEPLDIIHSGKYDDILPREGSLFDALALSILEACDQYGADITKDHRGRTPERRTIGRSNGKS